MSKRKWFAKLDGDMVGIDHYCAFYADTIEEAQEIADGYAEQNYSEYEEPFDDEDNPNFHATVEPWNDDKHEDYIGQPCFTNYCRKSQ